MQNYEVSIDTGDADPVVMPQYRMEHMKLAAGRQLVREFLIMRYFDAGKQPAAWCRNEFATQPDKFYVLAHKRDSTLNLTRQYTIWKDMGILSETDTSSADISTYANFKALVTDFEPNPSAKTEPLSPQIIKLGDIYHSHIHVLGVM